jgi:hypothetical protein
MICNDATSIERSCKGGNPAVAAATASFAVAKLRVLRIKARPSFKAISDFPPSDYDDTRRDGLKSWPRIKELIAA